MINKKYIARVDEIIDNGDGYWKTLVIGVWEEVAGDSEHLSTLNKIGEYKRNYPEFFNTFFPFVQNGEWFALYSPEYTCTRIMRLPECVDIGGEDPYPLGFCPVDYCVPLRDIEKEGEYCNFGFVSGCIWGDDASIKLQFFDLSEASNGVLRREPKFGYLEIPDVIKLRDILFLNEYTDNIRTLTTFVARTFDIDTGNVIHNVWDIDKNWAFSELALAVESAYRISTLATIDSVFTNLSDVCAKVSRDFGMPDQQLLIHSLVKDMIVDRRGSSNIFTWIERTKR